jgi:hypothetical protein
MGNMNEKITGYLGDMSPASFESEEQIREYFSAENLSFMFGAEPCMVGDYFGDRKDVMEYVIAIWRKDGTGRIKKDWYEGALQNGTHQDVESWFSEMLNWDCEIGNDLTAWARSWLSQDRIDEICARIDAQ